MNSAVVPSNSVNERTKNNASGTRNRKTRAANAGSINSKVRSRVALGAERDTGAGAAMETVIAPVFIPWASRPTRKDQAVRDRPAQHRQRTHGQRGHTRGVLQIDRDRRGAVNIHGIAQDVAEKRAAANLAGERVGAGVAG